MRLFHMVIFFFIDKEFFLPFYFILVEKKIKNKNSQGVGGKISLDVKSSTITFYVISNNVKFIILVI